MCSNKIKINELLHTYVTNSHTVNTAPFKPAETPLRFPHPGLHRLPRLWIKFNPFLYLLFSTGSIGEAVSVIVSLHCFHMCFYQHKIRHNLNLKCLFVALILYSEALSSEFEDSTRGTMSKLSTLSSLMVPCLVAHARIDWMIFRHLRNVIQSEYV